MADAGDHFGVEQFRRGRDWRAAVMSTCWRIPESPGEPVPVRSGCHSVRHSLDRKRYPETVPSGSTNRTLRRPANSVHRPHSVRHLTGYCLCTQASGQVNPHAPLGPVVLFGWARASTGDLLDQDAHEFPLAGDLDQGCAAAQSLASKLPCRSASGGPIRSGG